MLGEEFLKPMQISQRDLLDASHVPHQRIKELGEPEAWHHPKHRAASGAIFRHVARFLVEPTDAPGILQSAAIGPGGVGTDPGVPCVETDFPRGMPGH